MWCILFSWRQGQTVEVKTEENKDRTARRCCLREARHKSMGISIVDSNFCHANMTFEVTTWI